MKKAEFGKLLTEQTGINVIQIILEKGIEGIRTFDTKDVTDIGRLREWQMAREIVEDCFYEADTLFYYLTECENIARELLSKSGAVVGTDLPSLPHK